MSFLAATPESKAPFHIVPWNADFLRAVRDLADERTQGHPGRAVLVFPHSRPRRYLTDLYRRHCHAPMLLPRIMTGQELRDMCRAAWDRGGEHTRRAQRLDQVALLKRCVEEVAQNLPPDSPLHALTLSANASQKGANAQAAASMARFFPWGCRLADLLEECLNQMVDAQNLYHAEGEVEPFAAALLSELRSIRAHYLNALKIAGLSTPGLDAHVVAQQSARQPDLPAFLQNKTLILAGFVGLSRAEDALFRYLWEHGALVCLHTDSAMASPKAHAKVHWACAEHKNWIRAWKADCVLWGQAEDDPSGPRLHFFAGYDLHSQLHELRHTLNSSLPAPNALFSGQGAQAVVLPEASLLMPTLHHLPRKDINISLGYPLERSLLARLVHIVLRLNETPSRETQEGANPRPLHYWRELLNLVRHPYVRMLRALPPTADSSALPGETHNSRDSHDSHDSHDSRDSHDPSALDKRGASLPPKGEQGDTSNSPQNNAQLSLRPLLRLLEQRLRQGARLVYLPEVLNDLLDDALGDLDAPHPGGAKQPADAAITEENAQCLEQVMAVLVSSWSRVNTLRQVSACLTDMCDLLLRHGRHIWKRFPIDAECLFRLMQQVIPALANNSMADEPLPAQSLFAIVRQSLAEERVPFEADPLTGLQVLGMLETRLLRFDCVYLLDVTEDKLPGPPRHDPLLPDNLRGLLGLPDQGQRETLAAHTFYRLLAGARDVWLFWQEGVDSSGIQDTKKVRSRFVEKAIWDVESRKGQRLKTGEAPLKSAVFPLSPPPGPGKNAIFKTGPILARLKQVLSEPVSPSRLDVYLHCPARFFHQYVCRIRPQEDVVEGDDPRQVGDVLHNALRRAFAPYEGGTVDMLQAGDDIERHLLALFHEELQASTLRERLPAESRFMLEEAGPLRLRRFLALQPQRFDLLALEREYKAVLALPGSRHTLHGVFDRVDCRDGEDIILDYKSGSSQNAPAFSFWREEALWEGLRHWQPGKADPLPLLASKLPSVQLPCYLFLYREGEGHHAGNAAWVRLAEDGKEVPLFDKKMDEGDKNKAQEEQIPLLLRFLLLHMSQAEHFTPMPGKGCAWCPYAGACR